MSHTSPASPSARLGTTIARAVLTLLGGLLGYALALFLIDRGALAGPNNLVYVTVLGVLVAYLASGAPARRAGRLWERSLKGMAQVSPDAILAAGVGATLGLLLTVLLNNVLAEVPGFTWYWSQLIALLLVVSSAGFFVANRRMFPFLRGVQGAVEAPEAQVRDKIVDTSAIIDGRIVDVAEANFLDGALVIPHFVLTELQRIADAEDPLRRQRGRRGLEVLDRLVENPSLRTEVVHDDPQSGAPVDDKLVRLCLQRHADLLTTDYNLARVAALQGVRVLNVHQLASAVKVTYMPGERLSLVIVKPGREAGQGLAYLDDGTMVVVEEASELVGRTVVAVVTSSLQTNMGRMIFARPDDTGDDA